MDSLIKFPSAFSLPPSIIKLTQAFWLLDHEDWEDSVSIMLDPLLSEDDLTPDHHRAVLVALLTQGQHSLALKYTRIRRPPVITSDDIILHISVLLSNGAIQEAFTFQRTRRSSNLLPLFYTKAEELGKLDSVLQLSLTIQEEKEFVSFLQSSRKQDSQEVRGQYSGQQEGHTAAICSKQGQQTCPALCNPSGQVRVCSVFLTMAYNVFNVQEYQVELSRHPDRGHAGHPQAHEGQRRHDSLQAPGSEAQGRGRGGRQAGGHHRHHQEEGR